MNNLLNLILDPNSSSWINLKEHLEKILEHKVFRKRDFLCREGKICRRVYFIETGLVQHYTTDGQNDRTTWILKEDDIVTSVKSFFKQLPASEFIQALEPTSTWSVTLEQWTDLKQRYPELCKVESDMKFRYYVDIQERFGALIPGKAEPNYNWLMKTSPDFATRVPVKQLSSYLLISDKNLNKIRKGIHGRRSRKKNYREKS